MISILKIDSGQKVKIKNNIHAIKHTFKIPLSPDLAVERFVYSFIVFGSKGICLIDSGVAQSAGSIFAYIRENGRDIEEIMTLILTHAHPDHIGSARIIKEETECFVFSHENARAWIENVDSQSSQRPVPGFSGLVSGSVKVDEFLNNDQVIEPEPGMNLRVIHTPGHSSGSISLLFENERILVCADSLLLPGGLPVYDNVTELVASIRKLKQISDLEILLSSWDEPRYAGEIYQTMDESLDYLKKIHDALEKTKNARGLAPMELCKEVCARLGLPAAAVNSLTARSLQSNVAVLGKELF